MFCKVLLVMTIVGIAAAQYHQSNNAYGYGHHAVSSQNIVLHQSPTHVRHTPSYHHSHQPALISHNIGHQVDYHAPAHYAFEYSVHDPHTVDVKSQHETREGDAVHGFYSLHEADGTVRRVDYTADAHSGFNAVVHREGHATHVAPVHLRPIHHSHY